MKPIKVENYSAYENRPIKDQNAVQRASTWREGGSMVKLFVFVFFAGRLTPTKLNEVLRS